MRQQFSRYALIDDLNAEWQRLLDGDQSRVAEWATTRPELSRCANLSAVLDQIRADPDRVLTALVALTLDGDALAGRVALQPMLGRWSASPKPVRTLASTTSCPRCGVASAATR